MADRKMQQLEQIKELISTAKKLTVQLISLEVDLEANTLVPKSNGDNKQALRTHGYINWNSSHDILKTTRWKKLSEFTEYCGLVERGTFNFNFGTYINMDMSEYVVSEKVRFHEDSLYLNMSSPLVWAEILYIKELRKPTPELVKQFLDTVKDNMHTRSSFEDKYGLKWVEPESEACAMTAPIHELKPLAPILSPIDEQETGNNDLGTTKVIAVTSFLREDVEPRKEDSNEDALKALDLKGGVLGEKPRTFSEESPDEDDEKTLELYDKFSAILEKLSKIKHTSLHHYKLLEEVKELGISNEKQLGIIVALLFEKAIEEPEFSKDYAVFFKQLRTLKVPSDNNSEKFISFRSLLIGKCQNEFENFLSNDPKKTGGFQMLNNEEKGKTRVVATVTLIGELYKLNMLTYKVMDYCLTRLTDKLEDEKLESLCKLLTIIGKKMERQGSSMPLTCLKKMEELVVSKSNTISSHVKLMVKDVVDLGRSKWVFKSFVDSQLKTMDQIQLEAEQRDHLLQRINARDGEPGGQGTNGDSSFMSTIFPRVRSFYYSVDTLKLIADMPEVQNYIKLPPACFKNISKTCTYSFYENFQADPTARKRDCS